jgi:hydrogenase small subunit
LWDKGSFYSPVTNLNVTGGVELTANQVGAVLAGAAAIGVAAHAAASVVSHMKDKKPEETQHD